jgi:hypothetical protein
MLYVILGVLAYTLIGVCFRAHLLCSLSRSTGYLSYSDTEKCDWLPIIWPFYLLYLVATQPFKLLNNLSIKLAKACKRFKTGSAPESFY